MSVELRVPSLGESISEVFIGDWRKRVGDFVHQNDNIVEIESDKATVELPAPESGVIREVLKKKGDTAQVGEVIGYLEPQAAPTGGSAPPASPAASAPEPAPAPAAERQPSPPPAPQQPSPAYDGHDRASAQARVMPAAAREMAQAGLRPEQVEATGPGGRILKEDVLRQTQAKSAPPPAPRPAPAPAPVAPAAAAPATGSLAGGSTFRQDEVVPMSPIRRRIAQRLVEAQQTAALLTTFNEIDMSAVIKLRQEHKDTFQKKYSSKLGFMSFFVKASIDALKLFPQINAEIRGNDIIYHNYYDVGIAVSGGKGLVVPVLRNAERMSFAEIEQQIEHFGALARENKLTLEQLQGGTFTISNGGIFGSLLSTPIVNPPQSGILGLHAIQERPVAVAGQVVIRPMMYVAFTYDHRIIDGREAVTFLRRIKEVIEEPSRMLLEI